MVTNYLAKYILILSILLAPQTVAGSGKPQIPITKNYTKEKCPHCSKNYNPRYLRQHVPGCQNNPNYRIYACAQCSATYQTNDSLRKHTKNKHVNNSLQTTLPLIEQEKKHPFTSLLFSEENIAEELLYQSFIEHDYETVKLLLYLVEAKGYDANNNTLLHLAIQNKDLKMISLLRESPHIQHILHYKNNDDLTPSDLAWFYGGNAYTSLLT